MFGCQEILDLDVPQVAFAPIVAIGFGWQEMLLVAGVFVLLFGSAKLPQLMRNMGRSVNEFKAGMTDKPGSLEDEPTPPENLEQ